MAGAKSGGRFEVGIVVRDVEPLTAFYRDGLGLAHVEDFRSPRGLQRRFLYGDAILKLMQLDVAPDKRNPSGGTHGKATGLRMITLPVADIEGVVARCEAEGGTVVIPVHEWQPGSKAAVVEDPDGSCWIELVPLP